MANFFKRGAKEYNIKNILKSIMAPIYKKQGEYFFDILANWQEFAGSDIAKNSTPIRLDFAKTKNGEIANLIVICENSSVASIIKLNENFIIAKISSFFGFKMVKKITTKF